MRVGGEVGGWRGEMGGWRVRWRVGRWEMRWEAGEVRWKGGMFLDCFHFTGYILKIENNMYFSQVVYMCMCVDVQMCFSKEVRDHP